MPDIEGESDAEDRAIAVGNNFGNLRNDNKNINNSRVERGNITIHNHKTNCTLPVVCITIVAVLLLAVIALFICKSSETIQKLPPSNTVIYQIGSRGGVYWTDESGKRNYVDREKGMELYKKQKERRQGENPE